MEKSQFINFIVTILEESGFKVDRDFKSFKHIIDIYAEFPTIIGDFTIAIACKNNDEKSEVGLDMVKEMEMVRRVLKPSNVVIACSSHFSPQAEKYASEKKIKLLNRDKLLILAKKFSKKHAYLYDEHTYSDNGNNEDNNYNDFNDYNDYYRVDSKNIPDLKSQYYNQQIENKVQHLSSTKKSFSSVENNSKTPSFKLKNNGSSNIKSNSGILNPKPPKPPKKPPGAKIKSIFNHTFFLILLVVSISYLISFITYLVANISVGIQGLVKILSSLILSYGLVFAINPKGTAVLIKGTIIFFISLAISILMIIFL